MATAIKLKQINIEKIRSELKSLNTYTKNSLADATGLSVATCGNILKEMIESNEVNELENAESTGGRPSRQFLYNKDFFYVLILYLRKERNSKSIYYSISNVAGEIIEEELAELAEIDISVIDKTVGNLLNKYNEVKAITFGVPGVVTDGRIGICDYSSFSNFNIKAHYEKKHGIKVEAINDVNCIALGYRNKKMFSKNVSLAYIYYPIHCGPGAGIIIDGKVVNGRTNFAGEVSYLPHYIFNDSIGDDSMEISDFEENVLRTLMSVNCLINPEIVVLSGFQLNGQIISKIRRLSSKYIPEVHIPQIEYEEDIHESYINGLTSIALEQLTYNFNI